MKMNLTAIIRSILCLGGLLTFSVSPGRASGLMGADLAAAQKTDDLFVFFNFAPIDSRTDGDLIVSFKPTGEAFRALVTLRATTDAAGRIQSLRLSIARSFIDDRSKCIYAADLARSFLLRAANTRAGEAVFSLAQEISARAMSASSVTILTQQPVPTLSTPSGAFETYAGRGPACTLAYADRGIQLRLENVNEPQGRALLLTVARD